MLLAAGVHSFYVATSTPCLASSVSPRNIFTSLLLADATTTGHVCMSRKIIFDTDPGIDDAAALLFAHRHPDIELLGITTVFGNADIATVTRNARYLSKLFGIDAPIAMGASRPLASQSRPAPAIVHGDNGLGNAELDESNLPALDPRPAHVLISDLTREHPGEVTIVAVGRMTNLAIALSHDPDLISRVQGVVIMGGAFGCAGPNGNINPASEANILGDAHAADQVFCADWPVTAVGLDVTQKTILREADLSGIASEGGVAGEFLVKITAHYMRFHQRIGIDGCYLHDASALTFVVAPELFTLRRGAVRVVADGIAAGQTILRNEDVSYGPGAWDGVPKQDVAVGVEADQVLKLFTDTLSTQRS